MIDTKKILSCFSAFCPATYHRLFSSKTIIHKLVLTLDVQLFLVVTLNQLVHLFHSSSNDSIVHLPFHPAEKSKNDRLELKTLDYGSKIMKMTNIHCVSFSIL